MQTALKQNSGAAELQHLVDFLVDFLEGKNVAILGAERPVKRAEGTILRAEIRVVDVAVDLIGHNARVVFLQAHLMRGHAEAHEIIGFEQIQSLLFRQCHNFSLAIFRFHYNECPIQSINGDLADRGAPSRQGRDRCSAPTTSPPLLSWRPTRSLWLPGSGRRSLPRPNTTPLPPPSPHPPT